MQQPAKDLAWKISNFLEDEDIGMIDSLDADFEEHPNGEISFKAYKFVDEKIPGKVGRGSIKPIRKIEYTITIKVNVEDFNA
jgi:hypothetical protein